MSPPVWMYTVYLNSINCHVRQLSPSPCWVPLLRYAAVVLGCSPWVFESLIWFWVWDLLHGPYSCHIISFFEKSVYFRQPQLVWMSTFWKTWKWHQSNTPLTSASASSASSPVAHGMPAWRTETLSELSNTLNKSWEVLRSLHSTTPRLRPSRRVDFVGIKAELLLHMLSWPASMETELREERGEAERTVGF